MRDIFLLSNYTDSQNETNEPLRQTQRIKYTSFDASKNFLVFGASSGSIYLFQRKPCKFLHLVPNKHGPVNLLSISTSEKYVAFATQKGICVYVINLLSNSAPQTVSTNIQDNCVTSFQWSVANDKQFYFGDKKGAVYLVTLGFFMGRSLLNISVHPILLLETPIVQICDFDSLLLVSNYSKCILCNTEYEEFKQIGNRPRDGYYGACFSVSPDENLFPSRIYCARPGKRFWEVDFEGNVLQTHQFKTALSSCPPTKIIKSDDDSFNTNFYEESKQIEEFHQQTLQFTKLQLINNYFILTFNETSLYIFDLRTSNVILWCNDFEKITDCKVIGNEIIIFTNNANIITVNFITMHLYAIELVHKDKLLECVNLLKTNLKYFAEKAKEQNDLSILNTIKTYLIETSQYETLNDLSVIFDSIIQRENEISKVKRLESGIYVLENSFCDNLKSKTMTSSSSSATDKQFKDALLTVTGKFGKNIIKYKFNIFSDEQKSFVNELIPTINERVIPFKDINEHFESDDDIVCNRLQSRKAQRTDILSDYKVTEEEKTLRNLYIIFKSSKISNINFLERYSLVFDRYDSREIIDLLSKLEKVMIENGDTELEARKNCYEMYFHYLKIELIWEVDSISREFIIDGFVLINSSSQVTRCDICDFPITFTTKSCQFHDLGEVLIKFLWSRNDYKRCFNIIHNVPAVIDVLCRFYIQENQVNKVIPIVISFGDPKLYEEAAKIFDLKSWDKIFNIFAMTLNGKSNCFNCDKMNVVSNVDKDNFFYTWDSFLSIALQFLSSHTILELLFKYSGFIPNDAIDRDFFIKCLLK